MRGLKRNDWVTEICDVMSDFNDKETCSSWLMHYLGNKYEDEFVMTAVKLGYPMLTKKMDHVTAAAMWQESNISLTSQRIILRYLSNFFGSRLVVPEYCIDKLGQNYVIPKCDFFISDHKKIHFWTKPISKIMIKSLESLYCQDCSNVSQSKSISTIDMVFGGDHGQGKMRCVTKFIPRDSGGNKVISYVIKNAHIDVDHDTYDVLNNSIVKPINEDMKLLMKKDMFVYLLWNEDQKLTIQYSTKDDVNESKYVKVIQVVTRLLISGDLAFFATVVGKVNRSGCWCHWCNLSPLEWENTNHEKGMLWTIELIKKKFDEQLVNTKMTANEKRGFIRPLLFDAVPIENYIFSLLHAEIGVGNKILENYFSWVTERMEIMSKEEVILTNCLINYKIDLKKNQQVYDEWINNNSSALATLRMKRTGLIIDINERDDNNKFKRSLKERKELGVVKDNIANEINIFANEKKT